MLCSPTKPHPHRPPPLPQGVVPKADPSAFLFTLANPHNVPPQQLRPTGELPEHAVYTHCMFGPTWGSGYDLRVNEDMASGTSNVGRNYAVPGACACVSRHVCACVWTSKPPCLASVSPC